MLHGLSRCTCHESSLSSSREQFHLIVGVTFSNRGLERNSPCPMSFRSFSLISCIRKCEVTVLECYTDTVVTRSWCSRLNKMCVCVCLCEWLSGRHYYKDETYLCSRRRIARAQGVRRHAETRDDDIDHSHLISLSSATIMLSFVSGHVHKLRLLKWRKFWTVTEPFETHYWRKV